MKKLDCMYKEEDTSVMFVLVPEPNKKSNEDKVVNLKMKEYIDIDSLSATLKKLVKEDMKKRKYGVY
ncbi:MAG: hypothetical protein H7831_18190 [Magnetococcus sp. WYHC-3]